MGWIVYEVDSGKMIKYYRRASTARAQVTKHNNPGPIAHYIGIYPIQRDWACCSYRDYEGILMGLRGDSFRMWQFCRQIDHPEIG